MAAIAMVMSHIIIMMMPGINVVRTRGVLGGMGQPPSLRHGVAPGAMQLRTAF